MKSAHESKPPRPPSPPTERVGAGRALARWLLGHPGVVTLAALLLWAGAGYAQCRWSMRAMDLEWAAHPGKPVKMPGEAQRLVWICFGVAAVWLSLRSGLAAGRKWTKTFGLVSWDERVRKRVLTGQPVPPRLVKLYGASGLVGCLAGVMLSFKVVDWITWGEPAGSQMRFTAWMGLIALFTILSGASLAWEALQQSEWGTFAAGHEKELAKALLEEEREEAQGAEEEERTRITGAAYVVFLAGFLGGMLIMSRLPDPEGGFAFLSSLIAMAWSGSTVCLGKERNKGWWRWPALLGPALLVFLEYMRRQFGVSGAPVWWGVAGLAWGGGFGATIGVLYWRGLKRR